MFSKSKGPRVRVINQDGQQLMPTARYGKVRRMLKSGLATVVSCRPFTIQLHYETTNFVHPVEKPIYKKKNRRYRKRKTKRIKES